MIQGDKLEVIQQILKPLRKSQRKTITLVIEAMASMAQAASIPIAAFLSQTTGSRVDSALTRFYRLLHNPRLDDLLLTRQIVWFLSQCPSPLLVALDWTEWHPPVRMLLASVIRGTRAIPIQSAVFLKDQIVRSQNTWENNFLRLLCLLLDQIQVRVCFLADRGFRRVSFLKLLMEHKAHSFVVRIGDQLTIDTKKKRRLLHQCGLQAGHALDLGFVLLRQDGAVTVRVVGIWVRGAREPWWLATNREDPLCSLAALYDRRMAIEEQIRDTKGARFGFQLVWTQIKTPQALARFTVLIGLTILLLTAIGHALSMRRPDVRLTSKKKGHRLSLMTVGYLFFHYFLAQHTLSVRSLKQNMPPPTFRSFPWLSRCQKRSSQK